jgi:hypothetical protein
MKLREQHQQLLEKYIDSFAKLDELVLSDYGLHSPELQLGSGALTGYDAKLWRPMRVGTDPAFLEPLYAKLPAQFPLLYESLVLLYRWQKLTCRHTRCY